MSDRPRTPQNALFARSFHKRPASHTLHTHTPLAQNLPFAFFSSSAASAINSSRRNIFSFTLWLSRMVLNSFVMLWAMPSRHLVVRSLSSGVTNSLKAFWSCWSLLPSKTFLTDSSRALFRT